MIILGNCFPKNCPFGYSRSPRMQNLHSSFSWTLFAQYFVVAFFEASFAKSESDQQLVFFRYLHFPRYILLVLHLHDSISLPLEHRPTSTHTSTLKIYQVDVVWAVNKCSTLLVCRPLFTTNHTRSSVACSSIIFLLKCHKHTTEKTSYLLGYTIPKGCQVLFFFLL